MGLIDRIKNSYDYHKVDKYTKRRVSQSQFGSYDRRYYEQVYRNGDYLRPEEIHSTNSSSRSSSSNHLSYKQSRWSIPDFLKKSHRKSLTVAAAQLKTSETYTLDRV
ncbi:hypothetical protein BDF20DRAFT_904948 [Mycotypha africana]|uniref:uncharacterized protein n=1 Tax=Mycotypha africana TaxID=64632 RepID=UPI002301EBF7|nr:uncharacterized protein BDF20DRAFT_904948 [Mycotypha africana]KAI8988267.1 hypothetical protein BDF20DRAFT_904948 [Mycotypha africana]